MAVIRDEAPADAGVREALLDRAFGPARFAKTCERLREGRLPAQGLALKAVDACGRMVGTLRFWHVALGETRGALMLGPLAVEADVREGGIGAALMREGLARAAALGNEAVILVGDEAYYRRFGFTGERMGDLALPGPVERARFLGLELADGALEGASGMVRATGAVALPRRVAPAVAPKRAA
ncbi:GCN5 family N-acetyltransferase [Methylopila jiangsuensis]|uniref:GCN5 family N-acetyltransferase n=1 Tax=Methylopila jiangsuensis TaxID=586230 RepID=A0A9W6N444_9HYPH|nr:N-acetyltransferase [Methylopila jiangsuensis]MDR6286753.1 putative N-acetyltransferase YhbS [Methylopila jiangsuensis]GLK76901.1 GCN5 family N-acetyltransferase [Methylopila jiangsuensis]